MILLNEKQIFKSPKTDDGTKVSAKGAVAVFSGFAGVTLVDNLTLDQANAKENKLLKTVFENGKLLVDAKFSDIRNKLVNQ